MKRIFALALALILCAVCFVGCNTVEETEKEESGEIVFNNMKITFPEGFKSTTAITTATNQIRVAGPGYNINLYRVLHSSITPNEGYAFPTLYEFFPMSRMLGSNITKGEDIDTVDGIAVADSNTDSDEAPDRCDVLLDESDAFWMISVQSYEDDYETVRANAIAWAKTVVFE